MTAEQQCRDCGRMFPHDPERDRCDECVADMLEAEPCPRCGSLDVVGEYRDPADPDELPQEPASFGRWLVCSDCRHEWRPAEARS